MGIHAPRNSVWGISSCGVGRSSVPAIGLEFNWKREVSSLELMMCVPTSFPPPNIQKRVLLKKNASFPLDISKIALLLQRFSGEKPRKKSMNVLSVL